MSGVPHSLGPSHLHSSAVNALPRGKNSVTKTATVKKKAQRSTLQRGKNGVTVCGPSRIYQESMLWNCGNVLSNKNKLVIFLANDLFLEIQISQHHRNNPNKHAYKAPRIKWRLLKGATFLNGQICDAQTLQRKVLNNNSGRIVGHQTLPIFLLKGYWSMQTIRC